MSNSTRKFTTDWFSIHIPRWEVWLAALKGKPARVVEIGCWEGRASLWLLNNILTHPQASLTVMDTFGGGAEHSKAQVQPGGPTAPTLEERFDSNLMEFLATGKVSKEKGESARSLAILAVSGVEQDFIYIDGSHKARHVLTDAALAWLCLKVGGIMVFDDYHWARVKGDHNRPHIAVNAFLACYKGQYKLLHKGHQVAVEKVASF